MVIIFTYDSKVNLDSNKKSIIFNYYLEAIGRCKRLGYTVEMYTDTVEFAEFVDVIHLRDSYSLLWDSYKFYPLEERNDNFILLDGDVFLEKQLKLPSSYDLVFDAYESHNWNLLYSKEVKLLTNLGLQSIIPEWRHQPQDVYNCGVLYFNDREFKDLYVNRWKKINEFIQTYQNKIDLYKATAVSAQYLLTILSKYYKKSTFHYSNDLGVPNEFYTHHAGKGKYSGTTTKGTVRSIF